MRPRVLEGNNNPSAATTHKTIALRLSQKFRKALSPGKILFTLYEYWTHCGLHISHCGINQVKYSLQSSASAFFLFNLMTVISIKKNSLTWLLINTHIYTWFTASFHCAKTGKRLNITFTGTMPILLQLISHQVSTSLFWGTSKFSLIAVNCVKSSSS